MGLAGSGGKASDGREDFLRGSLPARRLRFGRVTEDWSAGSFSVGHSSGPKVCHPDLRDAPRSVRARTTEGHATQMHLCEWLQFHLGL